MTKADIWMPFYVSDYLSDTMHLTAAEHGAYLMLILHYWKSGPIPDDDARLALITRLGDAWSNASSTLRAFFKQCDGMLVHKRIDRERLDAISNKDRNQARAQAAANKRWSKHATSNATSITQAMLNECPSPSPSPSPIKNNTNTVAPPDGVALPVWQDFLKTRKTKITDTALNGIRREAEKAGITLEAALQTCCTRGWQSFRADWGQSQHGVVAAPTATVPSRQGVDPALAKAIKDSLSGAKPSAEIRQRMAEITGARA